MVDIFTNSPNTYFRLIVDRGMQEIKFSDWERLSSVEAHTTRYMNGKEVDVKLGMLANAITFLSQGATESFNANGSDQNVSGM